MKKERLGPMGAGALTNTVCLPTAIDRFHCRARPKKTTLKMSIHSDC